MNLIKLISWVAVCNKYFFRKIISFVFPFRIQQKNADNDKLTNFKIGLQSPSVKSGQVKLAMVAFWEKVLSDYDISSIYKAGKKMLI